MDKLTEITICVEICFSFFRISVKINILIIITI